MAFNQNQPSYLSLRDIVGERTQRVVVWIGSGLSAAAGLPTWVQLKTKLVETLLAKSQDSEDGEKEKLVGMAKKAEVETNNWISFQILKEGLGKSTYSEKIKELLKIAHTVEIPSNYKLIWRLPIRGILNLNIDRLATRAHSVVEPGKHCTEFNGDESKNMMGAFGSTQKFIVNLHGILENSSSWVFTKGDIAHLLKEPGYRTFLQNCLSSSVVLFLGITADDIAVGGHLENLNKLGIKIGPHFWLTNRTDAATDAWAESLGILVKNRPDHLAQGAP